MTLTSRECATLIRLLGLLQDHLESAIESSCAPGEDQPREPELRPQIAKDRRDWSQAEALVAKMYKSRKGKR